MSIAVSNPTVGHEHLDSALKFVAVGTAGTALYLGLYAAAALICSATLALVLSWTVSTVLTNIAHRRLTFSVSGHRGATGDAVVAMLSSLLGLLISNLLVALGDDLSTWWQLSLVVTGTAAGGVLRFVLMQAWLKRRKAAPGRTAEMV